MCRRPTILRRLSSGAMQGIAAFFSPPDKKKDELNVCSSNHKTTNRKKSDIYQDNDSDANRYTIFVSPIRLFGAFLFAVGVAFFAGYFFRVLMMIFYSIFQRTITNSTQQILSLSAAENLSVKQLPLPTVIPGKDVPPTTYTFKHFPVEGSHTSHDLHLNRAALDEHECGNMQHANTSAEDIGKDSEDSSDDSSNDDEETENIHLPAGQHLLVDIKNVDPIFLNSEVRLAEAMIKLVDESKLTLLSYHCQ